MNEINFNLTNSINTHQKNELDSQYDNMKVFYQSYIQKMDKSDFANSLTRYQIELNLLTDMKTIAIKEGRVKEIDYIKKRYDILTKKFKQFGITLKELN